MNHDNRVNVGLSARQGRGNMNEGLLVRLDVFQTGGLEVVCSQPRLEGNSSGFAD